MKLTHVAIGAVVLFLGYKFVYKPWKAKQVAASTPKVDSSAGINGAQYLNTEERLRQAL